MPLTGDYEPSTADWVREHVEKIEESGGRAAEMQGKPVILLTTIGAKSGKIRKTPLMRVEHNGEYAVVASLGGAPKNPVWYYSLKEHPEIEVQDGPKPFDAVAREVEILALRAELREQPGTRHFLAHHAQDDLLTKPTLDQLHDRLVCKSGLAKAGSGNQEQSFVRNPPSTGIRYSQNYKCQEPRTDDYRAYD
jgi:deazaflavin-dependent oxidoreductase (nitroreductase family)